VLETWNIKSRSVVDHSSEKIAAAYSAELLDHVDAIIAAFYRDRAVLNRKKDVDEDVDMLAVSLDAEATSKFLEKHVKRACIACFNSSSSVTVFEKQATLEILREKLVAVDHFVRRLQVDLAYHFEFMSVIDQKYEKLFTSNDNFHSLDSESAVISTDDVTWFSSITKSKKTISADASYWKMNMVFVVRFDEGLKALLENDKASKFLIEIDSSKALTESVSQISKSLLAAIEEDVSYCASWSWNADADKSLFDVADRLFAADALIDMSVVNQYDGKERIIIDLSNYKWNHFVKYWHENAASKDWWFRKYVAHDLLGSKILESSWHTSTWRSHLNVANVFFLMNHRMSEFVLREFIFLCLIVSGVVNTSKIAKC